MPQLEARRWARDGSRAPTATTVALSTIAAGSAASPICSNTSKRVLTASMLFIDAAMQSAGQPSLLFFVDVASFFVGELVVDVFREKDRFVFAAAHEIPFQLIQYMMPRITKNINPEVFLLA